MEELMSGEPPRYVELMSAEPPRYVGTVSITFLGRTIIFYEQTRGLSEEDIEKSLKIRNSCRKGEDEICAICLDDMIKSCEKEKEETTTAIGSLGCGHEYHVCCIKRWLRTKNSCPLCKAVASRRIQNID
ncbi:hypothetical protein MIMGU_mgv11b023107mg [Erythranthe guttata]|uniref:RING-type E3 ubiquitin transferase n=1 Tax=Erythranthe guttata TaxID=4155 RepID=A0A022RJU0_ERYGU|nr:hypothetical protein MIMGU_mgv11b021585mg [Erythranthe guttata]EYU40269.1 hypothetical protein MIMGU_mgv11b023107mg [Erythranthe guttata]